MDLNHNNSTYLFIDAGYARAAIRSLLERVDIEVPEKYSWARLGAPPQTANLINRTFYYDAPPARKPNEDEEAYDLRHAAYFQEVAELNRVDSFFCRTGYIRGHGKRARQKAVDIQIAVDMMNHAVRGNLTEAVLLSGDLDFEPLVSSLVSLGIRVTVWAESSSVSEDLLAAADRQRSFTLEAAVQLLPDNLSKYYRLYGKGTRLTKDQEQNELYKFERVAEFLEVKKKYEFAIDVGCRPKLGAVSNGEEEIFQVTQKTPTSSNMDQEQYWMHSDLKYLLAIVSVELGVDIKDLPVLSLGISNGIW